MLLSFISLGHRDDDTQSMPDVRSEYTNTFMVLRRKQQENIAGAITEQNCGQLAKLC